MKKVILAYAISACLALVSEAVAVNGPYKADWESLAKVNQAPEWFRDAKVGIYFHWGVYSVPAYGSEWYPRNMFNRGNSAYKHHNEKYGAPDEYGYDRFVPGFTAEHFDAEEWADLFVKAGARFAGPVCEHHDGYALWDSDLTPWNSMDTGPKRDITGELEKAIRKRDIKFVATFHHARNNLWEKAPGKWTGHYQFAKTDFPKSLENPQRAFLYGYMSRDQFVEMWKGKLIEVIDKYQPDLMWFDSWLNEIPEQALMEYLAYYYNAANQWGREVVVTRKQKDLPLECSVEDFEKGRAAELTENVWLTDDTISKGSWCYTEGLAIKDADEVIDTLVDIVSKNGQLLLNISPTADGVIPEVQRSVLLEMGEWLRINGEAIYNARPWMTYGEGPTLMKKGGHFVGHIRYGAEDLRYTRSKDGKSLYVTALGNPTGEVVLRSVKVKGDLKTGTMQRIDDQTSMPFKVNALGQPVVTIARASTAKTATYAVAFKMEGVPCTLHEDSAAARNATVVLTATAATIEGGKLAVEDKNGARSNLGFWDDASDKVHWLARVPKAGTYRFRVEYASTAASAFKFRVNGHAVTSQLAATGHWGTTQWAELGTLTFKKPGVYHAVLEAANRSSWNAVNVWQVVGFPGE